MFHLFITTGVLLSQSLFANAYGGSSDELACSVIQTLDGGLALAGYTESFGAGSYDFLVVKLSSEGDMEWAKTYGDASDDRSYSIIQTLDGGFALAGYTYNFVGDDVDLLPIKLAPDGSVQWAKIIGGEHEDGVYSIIQTLDGGFVLAGVTDSFGAGSYDLLIIKLASDGTFQWAKTYGGTDWDEAYSITQTLDGGFAVAGGTYSFGAGNHDFLVLKLALDGTLQWAKTFGGTNGDYARSITQTSDGGLAIAGWTYSFGAGNQDFLVLKLASNGTLQWAKTFGGANRDSAYSVTQISDGSLAIAGGTASFGAGSHDFLVLRLASDGSLRWAKTFGGVNDDDARSITQTSDGGLAVAGWTYNFGAGSKDLLLLKMGLNGEYVGCVDTCTPAETTPSLVENSPSLDVANCMPSIISNLTVPVSDPTMLIDTVCSYVNLSETRMPSRLPGISCSMFQRGLVFQSPYEADLRIYSVDGRLVRSLRLEQGQNRITLDKGVYLWQAGAYKGKAVVR